MSGDPGDEKTTKNTLFPAPLKTQETDFFRSIRMRVSSALGDGGQDVLSRMDEIASGRRQSTSPLPQDPASPLLDSSMIRPLPLAAFSPPRDGDGFENAATEPNIPLDIPLPRTFLPSSPSPMNQAGGPLPSPLPRAPLPPQAIPGPSAGRVVVTAARRTSLGEPQGNFQGNLKKPDSDKPLTERFAKFITLAKENQWLAEGYRHTKF